MISTHSSLLPFRRLGPALLCLTVALSSGCRKTQSAREQPINREPGAAQFDVCGLIQAPEMENVIGSPVKETKGSGRSDEGLRVTQCYYLAGDPSKSVSLAVTDRDPAVSTNRGANEYWEQTFGRYEKDEETKESDADKAKKESLREHGRGDKEEEEARPPKKISGIGDEAFWSGNRVGGALYVLKKSKGAFVRVSVGGADGEEKKIEKSKALASKALDRL
jgi:hypothetical protein